MGSWNETCAVSGLSIRSGEKIVFLAIAQNPWNFDELTGIKDLKNGEEPPTLYKGGSGCYGIDFWAPIALPIFGEYNDYGSIENISSSDEDVKQFTDTFKEMCIPLNIGENSSHDVPTGNFTIDEVLELIRESRAYTKVHTGVCNPTVAIGAVMIKQSVWDLILQTDLKKDTDMWFYKNDTITIDSILKTLTDRYEKIESAKTDLEKISASLSHGTRDILHSSFSHSPFRLEKQINTKSMLKLIAEMEFFYIVIGHLRISLSPTIGAGSQNDNRKLWKKINTKINKIIENENKLDKEDE